ncbi:MAG: LysR family transcriptional regulator [Burkholderiaceae bacterium]
MNRFEGLVEFMAVMEAGSFSSAARKLGASVAHVSRHVAALETRLGTKLFVRTTRRVKPTIAGEHLAHRSLPLLEQLQQIQDDILISSELLEGTVRLSMGGPLAVQQVVPQLARFCAAHPRIRVEVDLSARQVDLLDGRFDFALRMGPLENSTTLVARRFASMPMATLASRALAARLERDAGAPLSPLTVPHGLCLPFAGRPWEFCRNGQACVIEPSGPFASNNSQVLIQAAALGLGIIHIPACDMAIACRGGELMPVFSDWHSRDSVELNIVYPRNRFMPSRVRLLIDHLLADGLGVKSEEKDFCRGAA